jgi:hypothetical protein
MKGGALEVGKASTVALCLDIGFYIIQLYINAIVTRS